MRVEGAEGGGDRVGGGPASGQSSRGTPSNHPETVPPPCGLAKARPCQARSESVLAGHPRATCVIPNKCPGQGPETRAETHRSRTRMTTRDALRTRAPPKPTRQPREWARRLLRRSTEGSGSSGAEGGPEPVKKGEPTSYSESHVIRKRPVAGRGQRGWGERRGPAPCGTALRVRPGLAAGWSLLFITARNPRDRRPLSPGPGA